MSRYPARRRMETVWINQRLALSAGGSLTFQWAGLDAASTPLANTGTRLVCRRETTILATKVTVSLPFAASTSSVRGGGGGNLWIGAHTGVTLLHSSEPKAFWSCTPMLPSAPGTDLVYCVGVSDGRSKRIIHAGEDIVADVEIIGQQPYATGQAQSIALVSFLCRV